MLQDILTNLIAQGISVAILVFLAWLLRAKLFDGLKRAIHKARAAPLATAHASYGASTTNYVPPTSRETLPHDVDPLLWALQHNGMPYVTQGHTTRYISITTLEDAAIAIHQVTVEYWRVRVEGGSVYESISELGDSGKNNMARFIATLNTCGRHHGIVPAIRVTKFGKDASTLDPATDGPHRVTSTRELALLLRIIPDEPGCYTWIATIRASINGIYQDFKIQNSEWYGQRFENQFYWGKGHLTYKEVLNADFHTTRWELETESL